MAGPEMGFPYTDANLIVEDWRKLHMIPLQELVEEVTRAVFAQKEGMPVAESFAEYSEKDYCLQYAQLDKSFKFLDQLQALVSAVKISEEHTLRGGFAVLLIQFAEKRVQLRHFQSDNLEEATKYYSEVEKSINGQNSAVVLVSVSDMKELQEAYPSYFLNASEFIQALFEFNSLCKTKQYI